MRIMGYGLKFPVPGVSAVRRRGRGVAASVVALLFAAVFDAFPVRAAESGAKTTLAANTPVATIEAVPADEFPLGVTLPLTGRLGGYGQSALLGIMARLREYNLNGGFRGRHVRLVLSDNRGESDLAMSDINRFANNKNRRVPAVIGPLFYETSEGVEEVARQQRVVVLCPLSAPGTPEVTDDGPPPWVFHLGLDPDRQARALARFQIQSFGATTASILVDARHSTSWRLADSFRRIFAEEGGEIVTVAVMGSPGEVLASAPSADWPAPEPLEAALDRLEKTSVDLLYLPVYAEEAVMLTRVIGKRSAFDSMVLCGSDLWDSETVYDGAGRRVLGACFTSSFFELGLQYPPFQHFLALMSEAGVDMPGAQAICAYDAASLLLDVLDRVGDDPEAIRNALLKVNKHRLATGQTTITPQGGAIKPVMLRIMEETKDGWPAPVYAGTMNE